MFPFINADKRSFPKIAMNFYSYSIAHLVTIIYYHIYDTEIDQL